MLLLAKSKPLPCFSLQLMAKDGGGAEVRPGNQVAAGIQVRGDWAPGRPCPSSAASLPRIVQGVVGEVGGGEEGLAGAAWEPLFPLARWIQRLVGAGRGKGGVMQRKKVLTRPRPPQLPQSSVVPLVSCWGTLCSSWPTLGPMAGQAPAHRPGGGPSWASVAGWANLPSQLPFPAASGDTVQPRRR